MANALIRDAFRPSLRSLVIKPVNIVIEPWNQKRDLSMKVHEKESLKRMQYTHLHNLLAILIALV